MLRIAQRVAPFEVIVPRDDYRRLSRLAQADALDLAGGEWNFTRRLV